MALETFKAQLKAKAKTLGVTNLQNKRIDAYAATLEKQNPNLATDDDHAEKVDSFLELVDIKEIAAYDDHKATKSKKDNKQDDKADSNSQSGTASTNNQQQSAQTSDDVPAWAKSLVESVPKLVQTVEALQKEKTQQSIDQRISSHEKMKDIPEKFWNKRVRPEKEEDIDAFVDDVVADHSEIMQSMTEQGFAPKTKPAVSNTGGDKPDKVSSEMSTYLKEKAAQNGQQQTQTQKT